MVEVSKREHSYASVRAAGEEFLELMAEHDEPDPDGYFAAHPYRSYFAALLEDQPGAWDAQVRNLIYGLDRFPSGSILDIGSGHGMQSFVFARHGHPVVGLDTAEHRIVIANRIAEAAHLPWLTYVAGDARDEIDRRTYAGLWMHRSFHHIPERSDFDRSARHFFEQVRASLVPGGVVILMTSNANRSVLPGVDTGQHRVKHLRRLMEDAGLQVREVTYKGYLTGLPARLRPRRAIQIDTQIARVPLLRTMSGSFCITAALDDRADGAPHGSA